MAATDAHRLEELDQWLATLQEKLTQITAAASAKADAAKVPPVAPSPSSATPKAESDGHPSTTLS